DLLGEHDRVGRAVLDGHQARAAEPECNSRRVGIAQRDVGTTGHVAVAEDLEIVGVGRQAPEGAEVPLTVPNRRVGGTEVGWNDLAKRAVDVPAGIAAWALGVPEYRALFDE